MTQGRLLDQEPTGEIPAETPEQNLQEYPPWEYPGRRDPKWGTVTRQGLIVGRGPRQRVVPPDEVYRLAVMGCPNREIAEWFDINEDTLVYNFKPYLAKARSQLRQRLRHAQLHAALNGNATLLIWLGKQYLDQEETPMRRESSQVLPWTAAATEGQDPE